MEIHVMLRMPSEQWLQWKKNGHGQEFTTLDKKESESLSEKQADSQVESVSSKSQLLSGSTQFTQMAESFVD